MQKRLVLVCEGSLCPKKQPDVSGPGLGEAGRYTAEHPEEEKTGGGVVELTPVVTMDGLNGEAELSGHPGKEVEEGGKGLRLGAQRKSPRVMREIINHHQIVFITRNAGYRRCPQVTMNKIKGMRRMGRRRRKRKSNMTT